MVTTPVPPTPVTMMSKVLPTAVLPMTGSVGSGSGAKS
jgi:hypothetical protein